MDNSDKILINAIADQLVSIHYNSLTKAETNIYNMLKNAGILDLNSYNEVQYIG